MDSDGKSLILNQFKDNNSNIAGTTSIKLHLRHSNRVMIYFKHLPDP